MRSNRLLKNDFPWQAAQKAPDARPQEPTEPERTEQVREDSGGPENVADGLFQQPANAQMLHCRRIKSVCISLLAILLYSLPLLLGSPHAFGQMILQKGIVTDFRITTYLKSGSSHITQARITRLGKQVRFEPKPEGGEFHIYDYEHQRFYRIFPKDKIYFTVSLTQREITRAYQQGLLPADEPSPLQVQRIKLTETSIDGHPTILYLVGKKNTPSHQGKKKTPTTLHYSFVWEAQDLQNLPIRIVDTQADGTTTVIEYLNIREEETDLSLFSPSAEYQNLSPY